MPIAYAGGTDPASIKALNLMRQSRKKQQEYLSGIKSKKKPYNSALNYIQPVDNSDPLDHA